MDSYFKMNFNNMIIIITVVTSETSECTRITLSSVIVKFKSVQELSHNWALYYEHTIHGLLKFYIFNSCTRASGHLIGHGCQRPNTQKCQKIDLLDILVQ